MQAPRADGPTRCIMRLVQMLASNLVKVEWKLKRHYDSDRRLPKMSSRLLQSDACGSCGLETLMPRLKAPIDKPQARRNRCSVNNGKSRRSPNTPPGPGHGHIHSMLMVTESTAHAEKKYLLVNYWLYGLCVCHVLSAPYNAITAVNHN